MSATNSTLSAPSKGPRIIADRSLIGMAGTYGYSVFVVAAPWIEMVLAIVGINLIACPSNRCENTAVFQAVLIYNFLFSLVIAGPISLPIVRQVSDDLYLGRNDTGPSGLIAALVVFGVVGLALVAPFYALTPGLSPAERAAAFQHFTMLGAAWILAPLLAALASFRTVSFAFLAGAVLMVLGVWYANDKSALSLINYFTLGVAVANLIMLLRLMWLSRGNIQFDTRWFKAMQKNWTLIAVGFLYYAGIWIDNLIMWFAAPSGITKVKGSFQTMPDYDTPMFWAQLTTIPLLVLFATHVEKPLNKLNKDMQRTFEHHGSEREISERVEKLHRFIRRSILALFAGALVITLLMILATFWGIDRIGLRANQMGMLRIGLLGVAFHSAMMFCFLFMLFFDLRTPAIIVASTFLVLNALMTLMLMPLGFAYFGYGTMLASALSFGLAFLLLDEELPWLPYHAFVTSNASLRRNG